MSPDLAGLTAQQLHHYAAGYTDALEDLTTEIFELHQLVRTLTVQLEQAEMAADRIYHDAYCGCQQQIAATAARAIDIAQARHEVSRAGQTPMRRTGEEKEKP